MRPEFARLLRTSVFRLALGYAAGFVLVLGSVLAFAYWSTARHADARTDAMLAAELEGLRAMAARTGTAGLASEIEWRIKDYARDGVHYLLRAAGGRVLAGDLPPASVAALAPSGVPRIVLEAPRRDGTERPAVRVIGARLAGGDQLYVGHAQHVELSFLTPALQLY